MKAMKGNFSSHWHKRGVVDSQFNWIFVLIAGFIIFLFIISIVFTQKKHAEQQVSISKVNQLITLLKSRQQTADMYSEITLPKTDMTFRCDPDAEYTRGFTVKVANAERTALPVEILFTPTEVNTNKIIIWSRSFDAGFPVGIFTYLTTDDSVILIFNRSGNAAYAKEIYSDLNRVSNLTVKYISNVNEYPSYKRRTIVCIEGECPASAGAAGYIMITPTPAYGLDLGNVTFVKGSPASQKTIPFMTKSALYGAISSGSSELYSCQMKRALKQFDVKLELMDSRLALMQEDLPEGNCKLTIQVARDTNLAEMKDPDLTWDKIVSLYVNSQTLSDINTDLILGSCPKMY